MFCTHDVTCNLSRWNNEPIDIYKNEVGNSRVRNLSGKIELCKMTSHFELLIQKFLYKFFSRVTNLTSWKIILKLELGVTNSKVWLLFFYFRVTNPKLNKKKFNFKLLTRRLNFDFSTFELLIQRWKIKSWTSSY